jgi:predicted enzyme related to lactoylglutathione lyase
MAKAAAKEYPTGGAIPVDPGGGIHYVGWTFQKYGGDEMPYWLATTGADGEPGINGGLMQRQGSMGPGTTNTMGVENIDTAVDAITAAGGQIVLEKMPVPGMGWVAYALDTEGNQLGVFQMDSEAK